MFCDEQAEYFDVQFVVDDGEGGTTVGGAMDLCEKHYEEQEDMWGWPIKQTYKKLQHRPLVFDHIDLAKHGVLHVYGLIPKKPFLDQGHKFNVLGVNRVDINLKDSGQLMNFVVLAPVVSDKNGHGIIIFYPRMATSKPKNFDGHQVTNLPAYNAAIEWCTNT